MTNADSFKCRSTNRPGPFPSNRVLVPADAVTLTSVHPSHRAAIWLPALAPLAWIPGGLDRFVFPKLVLTVAAIAFGAWTSRQGRLPRPVAMIAGAGVGIFTLACLFSPTPVASMLGRWPRYEGLPVVVVYVACAWLGARLFGNRTRAGIDELVAALSVSSILLGLFSTLDALGWEIQGASAEERTGSLLGNATDQGLVAMMFFGVLFGIAAEKRAPLTVAGAVASVLTLALSGSRAAILAAGVVLAVHVLATRSRALLRYAAAVAGAVVVLVVALPQIRDRIFEGRTLTGRLLLWEEAVKVGGDRWWLGGPSTFVDTVGKYRDDQWVREVGTASPPDSPHAWPLQALVAGGVPLLLIAFALGGGVLVYGWRAVRTDPTRLNVGLLAAVVGYGVGIAPNFTIAGSTCLAAFLAGVLVAEPARRNEPLWLPRVVVAVSVAGALVFTASAFAERSLQQGVTAAEQGDVTAAEDAFATAARLRPFDGDVAMIAAQAMAGPSSKGVPGAAEPARRWALRSLERTPDTYASGLALAVAQNSTNELAEAIRTLDRLITLYPTEPGARIQRGIARFGTRDVSGARDDLRTARRLDPRNPVPGQILREIERRLEGTVRP